MIPTGSASIVVARIAEKTVVIQTVRPDHVRWQHCCHADDGFIEIDEEVCSPGGGVSWWFWLLAGIGCTITLGVICVFIDRAVRGKATIDDDLMFSEGYEHDIMEEEDDDNFSSHLSDSGNSCGNDDADPPPFVRDNSRAMTFFSRRLEYPQHDLVEE
ncbi:hypothetical protein FOL47_005802 [Perkinsus chesapeaki]|uniref:Uncharacterized protein n=1 Tax=Perkinsus chesapeaki TaxID=330153 RepID=A0A7J6LVK7_PERCH|nr:hypothetical protein FOL47_005802 [Perkinsus chesapeaki]